MASLKNDWDALLDHLGAAEAELAPLRDEALEALEQANRWVFHEYNDAELRWTYAGEPKLWLQCEVVTTRQGVSSSRVFQLSLF
ncbi:MAG: hypothetical protein BWZ10_02358 [candidate division BRC1 bacterium ADurb.BinA364]|nr:MAG: hypothetical protein BWZ10_02358 [candidate division BRC1 bacterium ADurb.BinA364]